MHGHAVIGPRTLVQALSLQSHLYIYDIPPKYFESLLQIYPLQDLFLKLHLSFFLVLLNLFRLPFLD